MGYENLLMQYGSRRECGETRIYIYATDPKAIKTTDSVQRHDKDAEQKIRYLLSLVDDLKDYRQALAARYAELETMPYTYRLKVERHRKYDGKKFYYVTITKELEDGSSVEELRETYPGKERHKALARYEELKKSRPGILCEKDIAKARWEK